MAAYTLDRFDNRQVPIDIDHGNKRTQAGLTWVGQYYSQFGEVILENMLHLSENFAGPVPPSTFDDSDAPYNNLLGQLWYDTEDEGNQNKNQTMKVYNGNDRFSTHGYKRMDLIFGDDNTDLPEHFAAGEMLYNTELKTLLVSRYNRWEKLTVELAEDSKRLGGIEAKYYMRKDIDQTMLGVLTAVDIIPLRSGKYDIGRDTRRWREMYMNVLNASFSRDLIPIEHKVTNLGKANKRWGNLYVDVVRSNSFTDILPLDPNVHNIGALDQKWNRLYLKYAHIDFYDDIIPINSSKTIGSPNTRWDYSYFNRVDINFVESDLAPNVGVERSLGTKIRPWHELFVDIIRSTHTETLLPHEPSTNLGSKTEKFNKVFTNKISEVTFDGDIKFDIKRNDRSKGLKWHGLNDSHEIYAEEIANNEHTRLVIESSSNPQDSTIFKNDGEEVLEVGRDKIEGHKDIQANDHLIVSDGTGSGISMKYNPSINAMEFRFI